MQILAILNDKSLGIELTDALSPARYTLTTVYESEAGLDEALSGIYDAAVICALLPKLDGTALIRRLREGGSKLHVLLLTPPLSSIRAAGLNAGADCCLSLPFDGGELLAQLRALLRRREESLLVFPRFGDLELNLNTCCLICGQKQLRLGSNELELMRLLMLSGERLISKEAILLKIWGYNSDTEPQIVETYISMLRKKLKAMESAVGIETIWRRGYHLTAGGTK